MPLDCNLFRNNKNGYQPLACKEVIVTDRILQSHGAANKQELFFVTKSNTIREHATLDLLYTHPPWLVRARQRLSYAVRVTSTGKDRTTSDGKLRIAERGRSPQRLSFADRVTSHDEDRITSDGLKRVAEI